MWATTTGSFLLLLLHTSRMFFFEHVNSARVISVPGGK
jgi:hypothetical protein